MSQTHGTRRLQETRCIYGEEGDSYGQRGSILALLSCREQASERVSKRVTPTYRSLARLLARARQERVCKQRRRMEIGGDGGR